MTLIEVVVVVTLTTLLMVATTSVLRSLLRESSNSASTPRLENAKQLIARDALNASEFKRLPNGFALRGPIALNARLFSLHTDAVVFYELDRSNAIPILWRRQSKGQAELNTRGSSIPIAAGVFDVLLEMNDVANSVAPLDNTDGWNPLPSKVGVLLLNSNADVLNQETLIRGAQPQAHWLPPRSLRDRNRNVILQSSQREESSC